jgi:hypothetical protein
MTEIRHCAMSARLMARVVNSVKEGWCKPSRHQDTIEPSFLVVVRRRLLKHANGLRGKIVAPGGRGRSSLIDEPGRVFIHAETGLIAIWGL